MLTRLASPSEGQRPVVPIMIAFSARTESAVVQRTIEGRLEKKRAALLGAPSGKVAIVFVDDVNMPAVERYGAQPPVELLRQLLDSGGVYDRRKRFWKAVENTSMIVAAAPPAGGRNSLTPRFVRHFALFCMPPPSRVWMNRIFTSILTGFLEPFTPDVRAKCSEVVSATVEMYLRITAELLPTPAKAHYLYNLRDVARVIQGLMRATSRKIATSDAFVRLWIHETLRVFHDRLITQGDKVRASRPARAVNFTT